MTTITEKKKRPRVATGQVVASTNEARYSCAKVLTIIHLYNPLNYKRGGRFVYNT